MYTDELGQLKESQSPCGERFQKKKKKEIGILMEITVVEQLGFSV